MHNSAPNRLFSSSMYVRTLKIEVLPGGLAVFSSLSVSRSDVVHTDYVRTSQQCGDSG